MTIVFVLPCIKRGTHLDDTLRSIYASAARTRQSVTVHILSPLPSASFVDLPKDPTETVPVQIMVVPEATGMMGKFDHFLAVYEPEDGDQTLVFSNDDVIFAPDFIARLAHTPLDDVIAGPVIRTPDGAWQISMFRKRFSMARLMFRIHDGGLYSRFIRVPDTLDGLNDGRVTVDGCCFIMNERTLRRFGRRFNFVAFLYMEEVLFQVLHTKLGIRSKVVRDLEITHLGGASLTHVWSVSKSRTKLESVTAVSRAYLGHAPWKTAVLRGWFHFESLVHRILAKLMS